MRQNRRHLRSPAESVISQKRSASQGFTLIELMVVIGILGVIVAIVLPNFAQMQQRARIRAGANAIAQDFRRIRERALSTSQTFRITSPTVRQYQVQHPDGSTSLYRLGQTTGGNLQFGTTSAAGAPPEDNDGAPGGFDFPAGTLNFESRGTATQGVAYITDGKEDYAVGVNALGKVKVYKYDGGTWH